MCERVSVPTCTNHSEYAALYNAAKEAQWLVYLFQDLKMATQLTPIPIYIDSSGVVSMVFNPVDHRSNKHIEIAHHFSREMTEDKIIIPQRLPSAENLADAFTKPLPAPVFLTVVPVKQVRKIFCLHDVKWMSTVKSD